MKSSLSRREFLAASTLALLGAAVNAGRPAGAPVDAIIDVHQHTNYSYRPDSALLAHQRTMGVTKTILLPAGSLYGLEARVTGNQAVCDFALNHPAEFAFFANEIPDLPGARAELEKWLDRGAIGIGEQKFHVESDSPAIEMVAEIAGAHGVPVLLHFQHNVYNLHLERFHKILEKFPRVKFIAHAQTWWTNIDLQASQPVLYPSGPVTPGGISDRLLADYPNMYCDLSAGSGLNALKRDPEFTRAFMARHQDKLLFGSDCNDSLGHGPGCIGSQIIAAVRELAPTRAIERKLLCENARKMFPRAHLA